MPDQTSRELLTLYTQIATLKLLPRTGWLQRGVPNAESVAEHTFGVTALALLIGDTIDGLDRGQLLAIAMLHDLAEALLSDLPASAKRFIGAEHKHDAERSALEEMLARLPNRAEYLTLWDEYARGHSREARLIKGLDRIELLTQALAYERAGSRGLGEFWEDIEDGWGDEFPILRELAADILARRGAK
ncbi:MAG: HD domain-containing protein [Roseiflexaceae bacterium]